MGKRKRNAAEMNEELPLPAGEAKKKKVIHHEQATPVIIQIIVGTYEKVLHGITASITSQSKGDHEQNLVEFADTFLLNAHTSAIRCLAVRIFWSGSFPLATRLRVARQASEQRPLCNSCKCLIAQAFTLEAKLTRKWA